MSSTSLEKAHDQGLEHHNRARDLEADPAHTGDEEFGGHEARKKLEKKLLRKLDARMSILIVIYILNYVRTFSPSLNLARRTNTIHL